jgi:hypothetical protein
MSDLKDKNHCCDCDRDGADLNELDFAIESATRIVEADHTHVPPALLCAASDFLQRMFESKTPDAKVLNRMASLPKLDIH